MAEDQFRETRTPDGSTHTTIIRETQAPRRGGGSTALVLLVLLVVVAIGAFVMLRGQDSEIARDNAIAGAAEQVGESAQRVGNAVEDAAQRVAPR